MRIGFPLGDKPISIIIPIANEVNKFIITFGCDLATITWDGDSKTVSDFKILTTTSGQYPDVRLNDGKCSPSGVLFAGSCILCNLITLCLVFYNPYLY